ncbi:hypothetical protein EJ08DRAFT_653827 [Tothia fuscella]|uniref:Uncharacterized protein n=1 Tax=Tothia fuscella TaxID=1048955 RepID=A0A9P4NG54_9PEZI|nr:hypothetical protein EJ08DRAFT_653827 [Tothia fuscella]
MPIPSQATLDKLDTDGMSPQVAKSFPSSNLDPLEHVMAFIYKNPTDAWVTNRIGLCARRNLLSIEGAHDNEKRATGGGIAAFFRILLRLLNSTKTVIIKGIKPKIIPRGSTGGKQVLALTENGIFGEIESVPDFVGSIKPLLHHGKQCDGFTSCTLGVNRIYLHGTVLPN